MIPNNKNERKKFVEPNKDNGTSSSNFIPDDFVVGTFFIFIAVALLDTYHIFYFYIFVLVYIVILVYLRLRNKEFRVIMKQAFHELDIHLKEWKKHGLFVNFRSNFWKFLIAVSGIVYGLYSSSAFASYIPIFFTIICALIQIGVFPTKINYFIFCWHFILFGILLTLPFIISLAILTRFHFFTRKLSLDEYKLIPFFRDFSYDTWTKIFGISAKEAPATVIRVSITAGIVGLGLINAFRLDKILHSIL